ncbi:MAG: hypothetical protein ACRD12_02695 [Acidimicrobiales bacterium]
MIDSGLVRTWTVGFLVVVALVAGMACSGAPEPAPPGATVGTEPPRTTTTDPYAIPSVIDADYVNRILAAFDAVRGDVYRLVVRTRTIPPEAIDRLKSVYGPGVFLQLAVDDLQSQMLRGFSDYRDPPGNQRSTVDRLITANHSCVFAQVRRDYSAVTSRPNPAPDKVWIALLRNPGDIDPWRYNPTAWYSPYDGYQPGGVAPVDPCRAQ